MISLFAQNNSLLVGVGVNCKSRYSAANLSGGMCLRAAKAKDFPEKFPVCREITGRQVRSSLHHQPARRTTAETTDKSAGRGSRGQSPKQTSSTSGLYSKK